MKAILIYWIIGSVMWGFALGFRHLRCPEETLPPVMELPAVIAGWPTMLLAVMISNPPTTACQPAHQSQDKP